MVEDVFKASCLILMNLFIIEKLKVWENFKFWRIMGKPHSIWRLATFTGELILPCRAVMCHAALITINLFLKCYSLFLHLIVAAFFGNYCYILRDIYFTQGHYRASKLSGFVAYCMGSMRVVVHDRRFVLRWTGNVYTKIGRRLRLHIRSLWSTASFFVPVGCKLNFCVRISCKFFFVTN